MSCVDLKGEVLDKRPDPFGFFEVSGVYKKRLRYFVDGLVVGSEAFILRYLNIMRDHGHYPHRKNPISHLNGIHQSLREQRNTAVSF